MADVTPWVQRPHLEKSISQHTAPSHECRGHIWKGAPHNTPPLPMSTAATTGKEHNTPPLPVPTFFLLFLPRWSLCHWGYDTDVLLMVEALGLYQPLSLSILATYLVCRHHTFCEKKLPWPKLTTEINLVTQKFAIWGQRGRQQQWWRRHTGDQPLCDWNQRCPMGRNSYLLLQMVKSTRY